MKPRVWARDTGPRVPRLQSTCHVSRVSGHLPHGVCHTGQVTSERPVTCLQCHSGLRSKDQTRVKIISRSLGVSKRMGQGRTSLSPPDHLTWLSLQTRPGVRGTW